MTTNGVKPFRSRQQIDAEANLAEFIRSSREVFAGVYAPGGLEWEDTIWPGVRWVKLTVGKRRRFDAADCLDAAFVDFAKSFFVWLHPNRPTAVSHLPCALRCVEQVLLIGTGSGSVQGLSIAVLDEAAVAAREFFTVQVRYHVGRHLRQIAEFVSKRRLVPRDLSMWKSPLPRPSSTRRTGPSGPEGLSTKMPSDAAIWAMAEIFANDPREPPARFASAVWALLMCAPWRISELLSLHVDAQYEAADDEGVVSYGLRYYGAKGFAHDIKWISKTMEPVAREAFGRIREMTDSARQLARHLETDPGTPFLYPDAPDVGVDDVLSVHQKEAYLRRRAPKNLRPSTRWWRFPSITEHWESARTNLPKCFPVFAPATGLKWSQALFCFHRNVLHETRPVDWYGLTAPTAGIVNDMLGASTIKTGVFARLGYADLRARPLRLTTHQARHYLSTVAERGTMAQEDLAKWAGRAMVRDNRLYNHMTETERSQRTRDALTGTQIAGSDCSPPTYATAGVKLS